MKIIYSKSIDNMDLCLKETINYTVVAQWADSIDNQLFTCIDYAAKNGRLHDVKFLHTTKKDLIKVSTLEYAVCSGNLELVQWIYNNSDQKITTFLALGYAAGHGYLNIVKWLYTQTNTVSVYLAIKLAIFHGRISTLEWLLMNTLYEQIDYKELINYAIQGNNPEMIKWLYEREYKKFTETDYINCAKNGYNNIIFFFYTIFNDKAIQMNALYAAIENQNHTLYIWLIKHIEQDYNLSCIDYAKIKMKSLIHEQKIKTD